MQFIDYPWLKRSEAATKSAPEATSETTLPTANTEVPRVAAPTLITEERPRRSRRLLAVKTFGGGNADRNALMRVRYSLLRKQANCCFHTGLIQFGVVRRRDDDSEGFVRKSLRDPHHVLTAEGTELVRLAQPLIVIDDKVIRFSAVHLFVLPLADVGAGRLRNRPRRDVFAILAMMATGQ